ncbi:MAG: LysM peptidoglycan-binding domain-containing protein [Candidatus Moraniibacteriota bacterium]|jgi:LysM repeat protein
MENFKNISHSSDRKIENNKIHQNSEKGFTRREFNIGLAAAATVTAIGGTKFLTSRRTGELENDISPEDQLKLDSKLAEIQKRLTPTDQQTEILKTEDEIVGKTFRQQIQENGYISIDAQTKKAIYDHWHKRYSPDGSDYSGGLIEGLNRMEPWIDEIKEIFNDYDIPSEYIFLAIPESHFDIDAVSHTGAIGPYQITAQTADLFDMQHTTAYDERRDPIYSAQLCAKHLKHSYERFGHDWSLALMDYNGGFTNNYLEYVKETEKVTPLEIQDEIHTLQNGETLSSVAIKYNTSIRLLRRANNISTEEVLKLGIGKKLRIPQERNITLEGFNDWLEDRINDEISDDKPYIVQPGDTLTKIQTKTGIAIKDIMSTNGLTDTIVKIGQKLKLPPTERTADIVNKKLNAISKFSENINYPEKFFAISDIIKSEGLDNILHDTQRIYKMIDIPKVNITKFTHTVTRGDTVRGLAIKLKRKYPQTQLTIATIIGMFKNTHNLDTKYTIRKGQKLSISFPMERPATLLDISKKHNLAINFLQKLNPAILINKAELPKDIKVRIPK